MGNLSTKNSLPSDRYTLEIESFSKLLNYIEKGKFESSPFQAGGHQWSLVLGRSGNENRGEKGHISLDLKICESEYIKKGKNVSASFKLFLLDQKDYKKHLIRKMPQSEADGATTQFNNRQRTHGFPQFISLEKFQKKHSRYLRNDRCIFEAEVYAKPTARKEKIFFIKNPNSQIVEFENFSKLREHGNSSKPTGGNIKTITFDGKKWQVVLEFNKNQAGEAKKKYLSIYLHLCEDRDLQYEEFYASFMLKVQGNPTAVEKRETCWSKQKRVGFVDFISQDNLYQRNDGFIQNDILKVEVQIVHVSVPIAG